MQDAGAGDDHVQPAVGIDGGLRQRATVLLERDVGAHKGRIAAALLDGRDCFVPLRFEQVANHDLCPVGGELPRAGATNATGAARDYRNFVL